MRQPEGFVVEDKEHWLCLLKKGLYGLKQGSRVWRQKVDKLHRQATAQQAWLHPPGR